jgi:hypothetical protein
MSHFVGGVYLPGSAVGFLSESKVVCVLLSKFWVICVFPCGVGKLLTRFWCYSHIILLVFMCVSSCLIECDVVIH